MGAGTSSGWQKLLGARWRGLKPSTHKRYCHEADRYARLCKVAKIAPWPVTPTSLEEFADRLGNLLPTSVTTALSKVRLFSTVMGFGYPAKGEWLAGLRLIIRGQHRRAWRSVQRATPLRVFCCLSTVILGTGLVDLGGL